MKKEFLQLCHKYNPKKHTINNWFLSEKLDGCRVFYDGGLTRGIPAYEIPWSNTSKDYRLKEEAISTGLWSRYGHVVHAPDWYLDYLPHIPLDGELYIDRGRWQDLTKIIKRYDKSPDWIQVRFMVIDSPPLETLFADGKINTTNFKKTFVDIIPWILKRNPKLKFLKPMPFQFIYDRLIQSTVENDFVKIHEQIVIPNKNPHQFVEEQLEKIVNLGGEGVIIRNPGSSYACERSHNVLKYKSYQDDEGIVVGYKWGKETELGSKLLGLMGSLMVDFNGNIFELSGFTDEERVLTFKKTGDNASPFNVPGEKVNRDIHNPKFPICSKITFRYRELSDNGIPKECRYLRKFE